MEINRPQKSYKRTLFLYIAVLLLPALLTGCSANPQNFTVGSITITLTEDFKELQSQNFDVYLTSDDVAFSAVEETEEELEYAGFEIASLNDYCIEIAELNKIPRSSLVQRDSYYYFTNTKTISGAKYTYVHCMFNEGNSYWVCEFVCKTKDYNRLKERMLEWADTIEFN